MCSTAEQRLAEIGRAIDDIAAEAHASPGLAGPRAQGGDRDAVVGKLAELWALLAELDPDIARRMSGYRLD